MRTLLTIVVVTVFFVLVLASLASNGAPAWFVAMVASIAVVVFASKMIHLYVIGPVPTWGYLIIAVVVALALYKAAPGHIQDAIDRHAETAGMKFADLWRTSDPHNVLKKRYAAEDKSLKDRENFLSGEYDKLIQEGGKGEHGAYSSAQRERMNSMEKEIAQITRDREQLKIRFTGGAPSTPPTTSAGSYGGSGMRIEPQNYVPIDEADTYEIWPDATPIAVKAKGCFHLEWDAKVCPIKIILPDGREFIEPMGPETVTIPGNNPEFKVVSTSTARCEFILTATKGRG